MRLVTGIGGTPDHLLALGDVETQFGLDGRSQLHVAQRGEDE